MAVYIKFECGQEDRVSEEFGPFEFAQLTYDTIRIGPNGEDFAFFIESWQEWRLAGDTWDGPWYSDVIIYAK